MKCGTGCKCKKCKNKILLSRLKDVIKELMSKELNEMTGTGAAAGVNSPYAFGKTGDATKGLNDPKEKNGYKEVDKKTTGTIY
jgi:ribosomal protein L12E/L44/L45/RPP1/RPP2